MWVRYAVRADKTVVTEIVITGIVRIEITAVSVYLDTILTLPAYRLIDKVPDKSAL